MIEAVHIVGFKRFTDQRFRLAPLTLLAGLNGAGKTSLLHALLVIREASQTSGEAIRLNGPFGLELGSAEDVRNWDCAGDIALTLTEDGIDYEWVFAVPHGGSLHLRRSRTPDALPTAMRAEPRSMSYLCAERLGPRSVLGSSAWSAETVEVGVRGEFCAQALEALGNRTLAHAERRHPASGNDEARLLKYEVERWLSEIVRPVELEASTFAGTAMTAMRFRVQGGDWVRAPNMGFGLSYALPIVLGALIARPGGLMLVENPEAHLHPAGQSRMGAFLGWLASKGVQVIVETHSDHVLNGIRRAIGEFRWLPAEAAAIHFFDCTDDEKPIVSELAFTSSGGVAEWPKRFFDQYQVDVCALTRVRRPR